MNLIREFDEDDFEDIETTHSHYGGLLAYKLYRFFGCWVQIEVFEKAVEVNLSVPFHQRRTFTYFT